MENLCPQMKQKFLKKVEEIFKYDKNNDGRLDVNEILDYETVNQNLNKKERKAFETHVHNFIFQCDETGDQTITKEELLQYFIDSAN